MTVKKPGFVKTAAAVLTVILTLGNSACTNRRASENIHPDHPFVQDFSIQYRSASDDTTLLRVETDRNAYIRVFSSAGLLRTRSGQFLFPGQLVPDMLDRQTSDRKINGMAIYKDQFIFIDDTALFSNAWAGSLFIRHNMPGAFLLSGGSDMTFLVSDGRGLKLLGQSGVLWETSQPGMEITDIEFDEGDNRFWVLGKGAIRAFSPQNMELVMVEENDSLTCICPFGDKLLGSTVAT